MPLAQFVLMKQTGTAPGTPLDTSWTPCLLAADVTSTAVGTYPIPVPEEGYTYSYETWLRLKSTTGPDNAVENIKVWYTSTAPGTGLTLFIGTTATYTTPVDTVSSVATTDATTYPDSGTTLSIGTPQANDQITAGEQFSDYIVLQLRVGPTATQGNMAAQILHVRYDES